MKPSQHLAQAFQQIAAELRRHQIAFAVVGGLAVSARARPRFTQDIDLAVAVDSDTAAEILVRDLMRLGYRVLAQVEQTKTGRLSTVRLQRADLPDAPVIDLLFASCGIEPEIVAAAEPLPLFRNVSAPVARIEHLLAMKMLSRDAHTRQQDDLDLAALLPVASPHELQAVEAALRLITERGFHRGRRLLVTWRRLNQKRRG